MHFSQRLIAAAVLAALSGALGACSTSNFDPTDWLDFLDTKKKLAGDRKPVFPEGVPGVDQGVPKDLYKGAAQTPDQQSAQIAPPPAPEEAKPKRTAKSKAKSAPAATAATQQDAAPVDEGGTAEVPPAPKPKIVRRRTTAPPPDQPVADQQPAAAPAQTQQQSAFPAPLPGGTFTR